MKNFKKIIRNQSGFSLVEILVAMAMSTVVSMAVMQTNKTGSKGMTKIKTDIDLQMWQSMELMPVLSSADSCKANFSGQLPSAGAYETYALNTNDTSFSIRRVNRDNTSGLVNGFSANVIAQANMNIASGSWDITNVTRGAFVEDSAGSLTGRCPVSIDLSRVGGEKRSFGAVNKTITINVSCRVKDRTNNYLDYCQAGGDSDGLWTLAHDSTPQYISRDGYVLIGGHDGNVATTDDNIGAPFQVNIADTVEFPATSGSGVYPSIKVGGENMAIAFPNNALFEDSNNCISHTYDNAGVAVLVSKHCGNANDAATAVIAGVGTSGFESTANGDNSVVLGASNVTVDGNNSIGSGEDNLVRGQKNMLSGNNNAIFGENNIVTGTNVVIKDGTNSIFFGNQVGTTGTSPVFVNSIVGGTRMNLSGSSTDILAVGYRSMVHESRVSFLHGIDIYLNCNHCKAMGSKIDIRHEDAMVFGTMSGSTLTSNQTGQFTAGFENGYRFYTNNSSMTDENTTVYFDPNGNVGIGKEIGQVPAAAFITGGRPKLFVNGDTIITGRLFLGDNEIIAGAPAWNTLTISNSGFSCQVGTKRCAYLIDSNGRVQLRGKTKVGSSPICTTGNSVLATLPTGYRPVHDMYYAVDTEFSGSVAGPQTFVATLTIIVKTNGQVVLKQPSCDSAKYLSFDGISFYTH